MFYIFTFITEVTILEGRLWPWAAAAMFAMVLRWFIWLIAMVTEAGGRLTGIRGCGIIMKGSSRPETHEEAVGYSMMHIMSEIVAGGVGGGILCCSGRKASTLTGSN